MVQKLTKTKYYYLKSFLDFTQNEKHLAEISKELGEPHPTVRRHLNEFESKGFIKKSNKGRLTFYKLNKENPLILDLLVLVEKENLLNKLSKNLILNEVVNYLHEKNVSKEILIFGSACNDIKKANDLDLLVVGGMNLLFKELENKINKKIHLLNVKSLKEIKDSLKIEIKKNHLLVEGSESLLKWLI